MFDVTDPAHRAALKAEVDNDPAGRGYAGSVDVTRDLLALLNDAGVAAAYRVPLAELEIVEVLMQVDSLEYDLLPELQRESLRAASRQPIGTLMGRFAVAFDAMFAEGTKTRAAVDAARNRMGSRAEMLFGHGTVIERGDWVRARERG